MYWKYLALTKMGKEISGVQPGSKDDVIFYIESRGLTLVDIRPDYAKHTQELFKKTKLSSNVLATFFMDFAKMHQIGMSVNEVCESLNETTVDPLLKEGLKQIAVSINDGLSLKEAFEKSKIFPKFVCVSLDAAERSGNISEIMKILGNYFKYIDENKKRIVKAMAYPIVVLVALTVATIIISTKLIPQLGALLPEEASHKIGTQMIINYAMFMKDYWWTALLGPVVMALVFQYFWKNYRVQVRQSLYKVPVLGDLIKELEFTSYFLNLYVYQKSGISIVEAITNIHAAQETYVSNKLIEIRNRVNGGYSLWQAFRYDAFFPSFIHHNIRKGEQLGNLSDYFHQIYQYYDIKSRDSIDTAISLINPFLLGIAISVLGFIIVTFFVPLYGSIGAMGDAIYR